MTTLNSNFNFIVKTIILGTLVVHIKADSRVREKTSKTYSLKLSSNHDFPQIRTRCFIGACFCTYFFALSFFEIVFFKTTTKCALLYHSRHSIHLAVWFFRKTSVGNSIEQSWWGIQVLGFCPDSPPYHFTSPYGIHHKTELMHHDCMIVSETRALLIKLFRWESAAKLTQVVVG